ncbi:tRNA lysidine(34) synthetase TilS [Pedobacter sp. AW31-3R]|uniref:tRNA lysidine(34) synthetase TilS n=1 Tax=Pedobacter sp. AW31-3R TaxID=3445781 RepID=UPI003F9F2E05
MLPLQSFQDYIHEHSLFDKENRILLTVSGGKDSVVMAHLFKQAGYQFGIAHCNFGLRAEESQRDERFVSSLAASLEAAFYVTHFQTKAYAATEKISTQMAARELRYRWFEELRIAEGYDVIAVAHHQGDVMETLLLNLTRGTGIAGLHGILPKKEKIVRPLLFLSRSGIDQVIREEQLDFVEDSSNGSTHYARNKIRLGVIPLLREINPNLEHTFEQNIARFSDTELVLQQVVSSVRKDICDQRPDGVYLSLDKVKNLNPQRLLLFEVLKDYNFTPKVVEEVLSSLSKQAGTTFYSASHRLTIDRDALMITGIMDMYQDKPLKMVHPADSSVIFDGHHIDISYSDVVFYEKDRARAFVDVEKLIFPLVFRGWQEGDKFMPLGMKSHKKLSDFFIDEKVPLPQKENIPLLVNGNGDIVWVAGLRQDNRYKVTATTKKVVIFEQKFN